jgi:hypothetical protein
LALIVLDFRIGEEGGDLFEAFGYLIQLAAE